jgi:hypothetical protein
MGTLVGKRSDPQEFENSRSVGSHFSLVWNLEPIAHVTKHCQMREKRRSLGGKPDSTEVRRKPVAGAGVLEDDIGFGWQIPAGTEFQ